MKLTRLHILPHAALIALAGLVLAALPARAVIVASDTFSITDSRQAGSTLSGSTTETGNLVWNGNAQMETGRRRLCHRHQCEQRRLRGAIQFCQLQPDRKHRHDQF